MMMRQRSSFSLSSVRLPWLLSFLLIPCYARRLPFVPIMTTTTTTSTVTRRSLPLSILDVSQSIQVRGGARQYDDADSDEDERPLPRPRRGSPPTSVSKRRRYTDIDREDEGEDDDDDDDDDESTRIPPRSRRPPVVSSSRSRRSPPRNRRHDKSPSLLRTASSVAQKTASLTSTIAWTGMKTSGKAALYLMSPKHVTRSDIVGVWRLDQSVILDHGRRGGSSSTTTMPTSCAANIELTLRGDVIVQYHDPNKNQTTNTMTPSLSSSSSSLSLSPTVYIFKERSWPQSCTIEFTAPAYQGPHDVHPIMMHYKASFRRKLAQPSVIKMVGHIYTVPSSNNKKNKGLLTNFGNSNSKKSQKVGTFVARRRLMRQKKNPSRQLHHDDDEFDDDYDEVDEYDEVDDDDYDDEDDDDNNDEYDDVREDDDDDDDNDDETIPEHNTGNNKKKEFNHDNKDYSKKR